MYAFPIAALPEGDNAPCEIQPTALAVLSDSQSIRGSAFAPHCKDVPCPEPATLCPAAVLC